MGTAMKTTPTAITGIFVAQSRRIADTRGAFTRLFCEEEMASVLGERRIVQVNHSMSAVRGTVRGLHYQLPPHAEMKMVRCLRGRVWDVALDLRAGSPTYLKWHAEELTPDN